MSYPTDRKSCGYFARYTKALFASNAIEKCGRSQVLLAIFIASREDRLHYSEPPAFWREELMRVLSIGSTDTFTKVQKAAIEFGLIHSIEGSRTKIPIYWTLTPNWMERHFRRVQKSNASNSTRSETEHETEHETERFLLPSTHIPKTHTTEKSVESVSLESKKPKTKSKTMVGFDQWYALYPKKVGRGYAEKAYPKAIADIQATDRLDAPKAVAELLRLTQERLPSLNAAESQYRPNPATWLNAKRYRDEIGKTRNDDHSEYLDLDELERQKA